MSIIRLDIAPHLTTVKAYADDAVKNAKRVYDVDLDYSVQSLMFIDSLLKEWKKEGAPVDKVTKSLYSLGSYAGEVLLGVVAGRWVMPDASRDFGAIDEMPFLQVHLADGGIWRPINLVFEVMLEKDLEFFESFRKFISDGSDAVEQRTAGSSTSSNPAWNSAAHQLHKKSQEWPLEEEPDWAKKDDLHRLFEAAPKIFKNGRVVWGALIQANDSLFDILGLAAAPGEVVFDPAGNTSWQDLHVAAQRLMAMKGKFFEDKDQLYISNYLANERIRVFGLNAGNVLAGHRLVISTTWFQRWHLPGRVLAQGIFPIVVADDGSNMVLPLPAPFWPPEATELWKPALEKITNAPPFNGYVPPAELARAGPVSLTEEGLVYFKGKNVPKDYQKARAAWEKAVIQEKNPGAMYGLGMLYEQGLGVPVDLAEALKYFEATAKHGDNRASEDIKRIRNNLIGAMQRSGPVDDELGEQGRDFAWARFGFVCLAWAATLCLAYVLIAAFASTGAGWIKMIKNMMPVIFFAGCFSVWRVMKK